MQDLAQSAMDAVSDGRVKIFPDPLRERLSRLAGGKTRLADQPAIVVGASDSDLVRRGRERSGSEDALSPAATTWYGTAIRSTTAG